MPFRTRTFYHAHRHHIHMSSLLHLPVEIVLAFLEAGYYTHGLHRDPGFLLSAALVTKGWLPAAQMLLFRLPSGLQRLVYRHIPPWDSWKASCAACAVTKCRIGSSTARASARVLFRSRIFAISQLIGTRSNLLPPTEAIPVDRARSRAFFRPRRRGVVRIALWAPHHRPPSR